MKSKLLLSLIGVVATTLLGHAQFSLPTVVTADSDVNNTGTTKLAVSVDAVVTDNFGGAGGPFGFGGNSSDTVNGVTFTGAFGDGSYSFGGGFLNSFDPNGVTQEPGMSANFADALKAAFVAPTPGAVTLFNLTAGHTYEAQIFAGETDHAGTETISDGTNSALLTYGTAATSGDEFVTDTFVASASSITLTFTGGVGGNGLLNAFNLRDEGVVEIPEPSTTAMLLTGVLLAGGLMIFRRRQAEARL
jgi:hypothetical protein